MKKLLLPALWLFSTLWLHSQSILDLREISGLAGPESALWWEEGKFWIVSNVNGNPSAKDGNGFLSLISPEGNVEVREWISGLDGPKGMALNGDLLLVADIQQIRQIRLDSGSGVPKATLSSNLVIPGALFLNDVVFLNNRQAVVSDTQGKALFLVEGQESRIFTKEIHLGNPNGLAMGAGNLLIAQFRGAGGPGKIISMDPGTGGPLEATFPVTGSLDGLATVGDGRYLISDFSSGKIFLVQETSKIELWSGPGGSADLGFNSLTGQVAVPNLNKGTLTLFTLGQED